MHKMIKGSIAIAAAGVLLAGGGGTLALWNSEPMSASPGVITAGTIDLGAEKGEWFRVTTNGEGKEFEESIVAGPLTADAYTIVPGETLRYKQELAVKIEGTNAAANLNVTGGFTNDFDKGNVTLSGSLLASHEDQACTYGGSDDDWSWSDVGDGTAGPINVHLQRSVDLTAVLDFTFHDVDGQEDAGAKFEFHELQFALQQIAEADYPHPFSC